MKSERTKALLVEAGLTKGELKAAATLVELAEEDARERAKLAFCQLCYWSTSRCGFPLKELPLHMKKCEYMKKFLKNYDNE